MLGWSWGRLVAARIVTYQRLHDVDFVQKALRVAHAALRDHLDGPELVAALELGLYNAALGALA